MNNSIDSILNEKEQQEFRAAAILNIPRYKLEAQASIGKIKLETLKWFRKERKNFYDCTNRYDSYVDDEIARATRKFLLINLDQDTYRSEQNNR